MTSTATENENVRVMSEVQIPAIPFGVALPTSTLQNFDEPMPKGNVLSLMGNNGVVGSIVMLRNSVMVWVGWGKLDASSRNPLLSNNNNNNNNPNSTQQASTAEFGKGMPAMGQLVVAMPRTKYSGAFGTGANEPSCSHIIGGESSDDQMLASQMASRLSVRSGMAVFVSCQLSSSSSATANDGEDWTAGLDSETLSHRAAALAEKEIWRILKERKELVQGKK